MNQLLLRSALPLILALPLAAQEHDLKLNVQPGSSVWYQQTSTMSQEIDMGQLMETENIMALTTHLMVKAVAEDGSVTVEAKVARVHGSFSVPMMGDFDFDSNNKQEGEAPAGDDMGGLGGMGMPDMGAIGRAAAGFAGTKVTAKLDSYGKVQTLEGAEKALEEMNKRAGQMGAGMLTQSISNDALKSLIESGFGTRPTKPTTVGASWSDSDSSDEGPGTATQVKFTLAKVDDSMFEVTGDGTIEKPESAAKEPKADETEEEAMMREMQANMKIENGKITGRSVVSRKDGFIVEATSTTSMDMTMPGPFGGDMSMKMKTSVVTKRTTADAAMKGKKAAAGDAKDGDK